MVISLNNGLMLWCPTAMLWRHAMEPSHGDIKISVFVYPSSLHHSELESPLIIKSSRVVVKSGGVLKHILSHN